MQTITVTYTTCCIKIVVNCNELSFVILFFLLWLEFRDYFIGDLK